MLQSYILRFLLDFSIIIHLEPTCRVAPVFYICHVVMRRRTTGMYKPTLSVGRMWSCSLCQLSCQLSDAVQHGTSDELARSARSRRTPMYFQTSQTSQTRRPVTGPSQTRPRTPVVRARCLTHPFHQLTCTMLRCNCYQYLTAPTCSRPDPVQGVDLLRADSRRALYVHRSQRMRGKAIAIQT